MSDSIVIFGWLNEDGSITHDRDEIINNVRKVVQGFKNSDLFMKSLEKKYDRKFNKTRQKSRKRT